MASVCVYVCGGGGGEGDMRDTRGEDVQVWGLLQGGYGYRYAALCRCACLPSALTHTLSLRFVWLCAFQHTCRYKLAAGMSAGAPPPPPPVRP